MKSLVIAGVLCAVGSARADTVGVVTDDPQLALAVGTWLSSHGKTVVAAALPDNMTGTLQDCFVIEDAGCAQGVVEKHATSDAIVFITIDRAKEVTVATHWIVKGQAPVSRRGTCAACTDATLRDHAINDLAQLTSLSKVPNVGTSKPPPASPRVAAPPRRERRGLAIGAELGEPTTGTAAWFFGKISVSAALGTGTFEGAGVAFHITGLYEVTELAPRVPLRVGLGTRFYHHGYEKMSIDELSHDHQGVFASASVALERGPLQIYAQLAPGIDVTRTRSCTFARGPDTICPHSQSAPVFVHFVVGARWFLSE